ncbi:MAG: alpha/beta hydrolase [Actinomycetota bacterium]|jgi:pimeloyl-ACP methyl ester carboxylesterase|nr:alpha/beta hydrolase [Actinomycetota bacterium]
MVMPTADTAGEARTRPGSAPAWFVRALSDRPRAGRLTVAGAGVAHAVWGQCGQPGLVLVHGGGANRAWWDHIAPWFADTHRVIAVDLSGHGDSDHRPVYRMDTWVDEVWATAQAAGAGPRPVLVGHSLGGFVAVATAARHGRDVGGVIVVDSPMTAPDHELSSSALRVGGRTGTAYSSLEEIVARFRTIPPQAVYLDYIVAHVARRSVRRFEDGWRWKYDSRVFTQFAGGMRASALPLLADVRCRFALLAAEHGLVTPRIGSAICDTLGRSTPVVWLPDAGHHPMLDQPLALVSAVRAVLAGWGSSIPL